MKRRAALQFVTALGAGVAVLPGVLDKVRFSADKHFDRAVGLDDWEQAVHEYGQRVMGRPAGSLLNDLATDVIAVGRRLDRPHAPLERAGLLRTSAGLSGLMAIELGDIGDTRAARVSWSIARRAADASGDKVLRVWVRGRAAQDAYWGQRSDQIVSDLTDEAIGIAGGKPSAGLARAYAARAYLAAGQGNRNEALASIEKTKETFERLTQGTDGPTVLTYRESQLRWAESYVFTRLGDDRGMTALTRALDLFPPDARGAVANLNLMRAAALVKARDVDAGLHHAVTTAQKLSESTTVRTRLLTGQILRALPDQVRGLPAAHDLRALTSVA
ncbi:XRE family transcriptional regulator [Actinomadura graeca]|uniref:XRE family transcriptional regulator n=1 Tax=Actinomadura graeca TaxID=2750812 RepID=A0ABX8QSB4_9ACTN|nr:XRE family transcriptional regulator [Actinomadura graeca]QXJ21632.1 XRE family transcriptional regulator [Actinomadura graeca]